MCVVFFIVIRWIVHFEQKEKHTAPYGLLSVAGVYAVTLKLTAGCILLLVIALTAGVLYRKFRIPPAAERIFGVLLLAFLAVKAVTLAKYVWSVSDEPYYIAQQDYGTYELNSFEVSGVRFYYPVSGDRTGYDAFPSLLVKKEILFRGNGLQDGFRGK